MRTFLVLLLSVATPALAQPAWSGYANGPQHTALSPATSNALDSIRWSAPVDLAPQYVGGEYLLIHYGSPMISAANTVIVPVKTGTTGGFELRALDGATGAIKWTAPTDYILPTHSWTPSYSPTLTPANRVYYPGAGGTVYFRDNIDSNSPSAAGQIAFFGNANYTSSAATYNSNVFISTPITSDASGNIYFGYRVTNSSAVGFSSGIARIAADGTPTFTSAATASGDAAIKTAVMNCAPAISSDGSKLYIAVSNGPASTSATGRLIALNSSTLAPIASVQLKDPKSGNNAWLPDNGSSSPTIGPDGDVYFGVLEAGPPSNNYRGWLTHFSSDLSTTKTAGAFGWDITASVVPASMVPSYSGSSTYLLMTKYNNYAGVGGDGVNKLAILDPNDTQTFNGTTVMKEILTIAGVTPDQDKVANFPNAVREWCINSAVVDPATHSILVNSEDGKLYRWDLWTNTLSDYITLTAGLGQAYTPTLVGPDGSIYAINDATLFSVVPEPGAILLLTPLAAMLISQRSRRPC